MAALGAVLLGACAGTPAPDGPFALAVESNGATLLRVLEFAATLPDLPISEQRALIDLYASLPEEELAIEDSLRLALIYLNVSARPAELARAEVLLAEAVARNGDGEPELATFARLLSDALHTLPPPAVAPPTAVAQTPRPAAELAALRRELDAERSRRQRLEAQLEALLELELELGAEAEEEANGANR